MRKNISLPEDVRQMLSVMAKEDRIPESQLIQRLIIEEWDYRDDKQRMNNLDVPEE